MSERKIRVIATTGTHGYTVPLIIGKGPASRTLEVPLDVSDEMAISQRTEPVSLELFGYWLFRDTVVQCDPGGTPAPSELDELTLRIKHAVLRHERALRRIRHQVEAFENLEAIPSAKREQIAEPVRLFVWQRDEGKCVRCGRRDMLEYDHIIPVIEGGSSTERNVQLLCESCNRGKGRQV